MSTLCFGCMQNKESRPVCELCGFDETKQNLSHQLPTGTLLQNQYLVGKVLGQGGFGITYMGWDQQLSIPVAIKEYFPGGVVQRHTQLSTQVSCVNGEASEIFRKHRDRFLKEARTLAQFSGIPEVVQIKSFFPENNTAYIVMEYVQGITLKDHLKKLGRPMAESEALSIMEPALRALQKVHAQSLIHRDISPDNIMLPISGGVKLIDFGTVRYLDDSGKSKSTETVLKPGFAPMEQYLTKGNLGTWTDVYALCATFYYLLTGKVPEESMARMDCDETLPKLRSRQDLSDGVIAALEKGMKVRVSDRIQTVQELYEYLYEGKSLQTNQESLPAKKEESAKKKYPKGNLPAIFITVALAVACLFSGIQKEDPIPSEPISETAQSTTTTLEQEVSQQPSSGMSEMDIRYEEAMNLAQSGQTAQAAIAFGKLGNYRDAQAQSFALWDRVAKRDTVSACFEHFAAIRTDGTVMTCCQAYNNVLGGQSWNDVIALSARGTHLIGLKADGTVVAAGSNNYGQCDVQQWQNIVAISTHNEHTVGLKSDGTVVAVGKPLGNEYYPMHLRTAVEKWTDIIAISTNEHQTMGLKIDGTVLTTGSSNWDQSDLADWKNITAISAANWHAVGLRSDGTAVSTTRWNDWGQCNVSDWTDLVSISGGFLHTVGLKKDGTVVAAGSNKNHFAEPCGQCDVSDWHDIVFLTAGEEITVALRADGTILKAGEPWYGMHSDEDKASWTGIRLPD